MESKVHQKVLANGGGGGAGGLMLGMGRMLEELAISFHLKRKYWGGLAAAALVAAAGAIIAHRLRESGFAWSRFLSTFVQVDWRWLLAAMLLALATYFGRALRWEVMIRPLQPRTSLWRLFVATAIGFTAVVIFGRPGEFVRPYLIAVKEKLPLSSQLAAWILERIYDLLVVLSLFGFALTRLHRTGAAVGPTVHAVLATGGYIVAILCSLCLLILIGLRYFSQTMQRRLIEGLAVLPDKPRAMAERIVTAFVSGMGSTRKGSFVALLVAYTTLEWLIIVACFYCLFRSFPATAHLGVMDVLIFVGFVAFGSVLQIPGVGGGMQVAAFLALTEIFDIPVENAGGISILLWLVTFAVILPFGLLLAFREGLNWSKLREIEQKASSL
jgi:uncharacterized protein (TIRG00374 family)